MPATEAQELTIPATDGFALAATAFGGGSPGRVVLVAPATGVRRRLYRPFAEFLAAEGLGVVTWDWRGIGGSRPERLRGFQARMRDWGERDLAGVIRWAAESHPGARLVALGHSYGGQGIGLAPNAGRLDALVTVAAQSGYWGLWPAPERYKLALLWHVAVPALTHLLGFFPSSRVGLAEDLPGKVALEWARWCRSPDYLGDYAGHARITAPLLALSFADDALAPRRAVEELSARYGSRDRMHRHVAPAEVGAERIGHFGFFRPGVVPELWRDTAEWILSR